MTRLVIINGPPRSGKDTAAGALWRTHENCKWMRMSGPIKAALHAMFNFTDDEQLQLEQSKGGNASADTKLAMLLDKTWRGAQISFSEQWAKPYFGPDIFGHLFARQLKRTTAPLTVCSDAGFAIEWEKPLKVVGKRNALLIKLSRRDTSYVGDSRTYIELPGVMTVHVVNNGELREFENSICEVVRQWLVVLDN